ncbi:hypothetical protein [Streptomyces sp. ITFR-6]|uniref:hypothetical protein n=1 Tax=Streptomyces sp. ITFR-6 TaxID=3075197 RepID=UPI002889D4C4|nr:hypothetical protein [Streptomyces sp. ITFR-6]WNI31665.1 hypothetical protein RLT59_24880 [Streptomyces sp. ITFR-6]
MGRRPRIAADRTRWGGRLVRAAAFACASVVLAAAAHHGASRQPVPGTTVLVMAAVLFALAWPVCGRARTLPTMVIAKLAVQGAAHSALSAVAQPGGGAHAAHHLDVPAAGGHGMALAPAVMLTAHLAAAVVVAAMLQAADGRITALPSHLARLAAAARARLRRWQPVLRLAAVVRPCPRGLPSASRRKVGVGTLLAHVLTRRGPPVLTCRSVTAGPFTQPRTP